MNIKPKAQIGEIVNIIGCDFVQTSHGWNVVHLQARFNGKPCEYYIHDIKVEISLKTGETKYNYLIASSKEYDPKWFHGGWVADRNIELSKVEEIAV